MSLLRLSQRVSQLHNRATGLLIRGGSDIQQAQGACLPATLKTNLRFQHAGAKEVSVEHRAIKKLMVANRGKLFLTLE